MHGTRRRLLDVLDRVHLAKPAARAYERALAARAALGAEPKQTDGLPLPPARLRTQVGPGHADAGFFLKTGREHADFIRSLIGEAGGSMDEFETLLDWGCGCGRVLRWWADLPGTRVYGCDINRGLVEWCQANLSFAEVKVSQIAPPLPYPDASFDFVYAISVFTHQPRELQQPWIRECRRVLRPGGFLLFSTLGERYAAERLKSTELETFRRGELVVLFEGSPGSNLCSAYHPAGFVTGTLAAEFEALLFRPGSGFGGHDAYVFRVPV